MKWIFFADSSQALGIGHAVRLLAVAEYAHAQGVKILFCYRSCLPEVKEMWRSVHAEFLDLNGGAHLSAQMAQAIVFDLRHISAEMQCLISELDMLKVAFDDAAEQRTLPADIVVNASTNIDVDWYARWQPESCCLLGSRYAPIRRKFLVEQGSHAFSHRKRLLIIMGGTDVKRLSLPLAVGLLESGAQVSVVVLSQKHPDFDGLKKLADMNLISLHTNPENLPSLMATSGFAVSGGGGTLNELAALQVPTLVLAYVDDQVQQLSKLQISGWCECLDVRKETDLENLNDQRETQLQSLIKKAGALWLEKELRESMSKKAKECIDGLGSQRIVQKVMSSLKQDEKIN